MDLHDLLLQFIKERKPSKIIPTLSVFCLYLKKTHGQDISLAEVKRLVMEDPDMANAYDEYKEYLQDYIMHMANMKMINVNIAIAYLRKNFNWDNDTPEDDAGKMTDEQLEAAIKGLDEQ
jgi:hypothetical protein